MNGVLDFRFLGSGADGKELGEDGEMAPFALAEELFRRSALRCRDCGLVASSSAIETWSA
jgi:hypothetical protein